MMSTWWFWQPIIPLPYKVRVGTREMEFSTNNDLVRFLMSEESDYMYATSQVDIAVFANMLNINIYTFIYNQPNNQPERWQETMVPHPYLAAMCEYMNRAPLDVALYNCDAYRHPQVQLSARPLLQCEWVGGGGGGGGGRGSGRE